MSILVNVKMYPAQDGDCFLLSFGEMNKKKKNFLIDCGYTSTFKNYLKKDLLKIAENRENLERLILTHIDADHIKGAISFLKSNNLEKYIQIKEIWHNAYRHLYEKKEGNLLENKQVQVLQNIIKRGHPQNEADEEEQTISANQGTTFGALILQGKYSWNSDFKNQAVQIEEAVEIKLDTEASIYLLSPDKQKLEKLREFWKSELKKYDVNFDNDSELYDDAFEMLASWENEKIKKVPKEISGSTPTIEELVKEPFDEDNTATNGSSIAFILNIKNKKLLFLADAHPDLIVKSLRKYQDEGKIVFDLIKVSHHGSFNNISKELLDKIDSDKYLISTNGKKHSHPDKETIAHIVHRKSNFPRKLYFNYVTSSSEYFNRTDWMEQYNYSINYLNIAPFTLEI